MNREPFEPIIRIVGLGADKGDGHTRITQGDNFHVLFGSDHDHAQLVEACAAISDKLKEKGLRLDEVSREEFIALLQELDLPDDPS
ncbi:MAG: hypothetical protein EOM20_05760 [Spartobacteria bacterium]|nr:hypothetical protein [Spartobacteria bacterium]